MRLRLSAGVGGCGGQHSPRPSPSALLAPPGGRHLGVWLSRPCHPGPYPAHGSRMAQQRDPPTAGQGCVGGCSHAHTRLHTRVHTFSDTRVPAHTHSPQAPPSLTTCTPLPPLPARRLHGSGDSPQARSPGWPAWVALPRAAVKCHRVPGTGVGGTAPWQGDSSPPLPILTLHLPTAQGFCDSESSPAPLLPAARPVGLSWARVESVVLQ